MNELVPGVFSVDNGISNDVCNQFIDFYSRNGFSNGTLLNSTTMVPYQDDSMRRVQIAYSKPGNVWEFEILRTVIRQYVNPAFSTKILSFELPQFLRYPVGGHYTPHWDGEYSLNGMTNWIRTGSRTHSLLLYLNSEFTGGELVFPDLNLEIKPRAGQIVFFPSTRYFKHGAMPTLSGTRMALVTWMSNDSYDTGVRV